MTQTMFHQIFSWSCFQPLASSFKHKNALQSFILKTNKPTKYFLDSQLLVVLVLPVLHFLCSQTSWKSSSCSQSPCSSPPVHCPHSFLIATAVTTATFSLPWPLFGTCHYWQFVFLKTRFIWLLWYSCLLVFFFALYCLICDLFPKCSCFWDSDLVSTFSHSELPLFRLPCFKGLSFPCLLSFCTHWYTPKSVLNSDLKSPLEYILITYWHLDLNVAQTSQTPHIPNWFFTLMLSGRTVQVWR